MDYLKNKFIWLEEYEIGDDAIDQQHKYLLDLANQIIDPFNDAQKTYHKLIALSHSLREHFKVEESLMKQCNFLDYKEHVKGHNEILQQLSEIISGINIGDVSPAGVVKFIGTWHYEHFVEKDILLADLLHRKPRNRKHKSSERAELIF